MALIDNYALRRIKKERHFTIRRLSEESGISPNTLAPYTTNKKPITRASYRTLQALAVVLECRIEDIMPSRIDGVEQTNYEGKAKEVS